MKIFFHLLGLAIVAQTFAEHPVRKLKTKSKLARSKLTKQNGAVPGLKGKNGKRPVFKRPIGKRPFGKGGKVGMKQPGVDSENTWLGCSTNVYEIGPL